MPTTEETLTMNQVRTIPTAGIAEIVTRDAVIESGRSSFSSQDELKSYLIETLGAKTQVGGIGGSVSWRGRYVRRSADGTPTITFGDPVLDTISSATGSVVIGGQTIHLQPMRPQFSTQDQAGGAGGVVAHDAPALKMTGIIHDAERWATDDGSYVEYRIRNGRLGFKAWRNSNVGFWQMGVQISVWDTPADFEAAAITALNFMSVNAPCQQFSAGGKGAIVHYDDTQVELSDWGLFSQQPERVAGMCQARWHHRQFADLVTAGSGCLVYKTPSLWPTLFPGDWTPIVTATNLNGNWTDGSARSAVIAVTRRSLSIDMSDFGRPAASGAVDGYEEITATFPDDKTYKGQIGSNVIRWSNGSQWTKVINTAFDLNGTWTDGSPWVAIISEGSSTLAVDMSDFDRPNAQGKIIDASTITVTFPDDQTYTGTLASPGTIKWSNGSSWIKKSDE